MTKVVQYPDKSNNPAFAFTIADDTAILHYTESLQNFVSTHGPFIFNAIKDLIPTLQGPQGPAGAAATKAQTFQVLDTDRTTNWTPAQCLTNWPAQCVKHFKNTGSMGTIPIPSGYKSTYCILTTTVPGVNSGYGYPRQSLELTDVKRPFTFIRIGVSDTAWSAWELMTTW